GQVHIFGLYEYFESNDVDILNRDVEPIIPNVGNIVQISVGSSQSLLLTNNGQVYKFLDIKIDGLNEIDEHIIENSFVLMEGLNIDLAINIDVPTLIKSLSDIIIQVSAGSYHSLILTNNGHVYSFGNNHDGELGLGSEYNKNRPTLINNLNNIIQISAGYDYSLTLTSDVQIYSFGINNYGQLGLGDDENKNI